MKKYAIIFIRVIFLHDVTKATLPVEVQERLLVEARVPDKYPVEAQGLLPVEVLVPVPVELQGLLQVEVLVPAPAEVRELLPVEARELLPV